MRITWLAAEPPLPAVAACGCGPAADLLLARAEASEQRWTVRRFPGWTVVAGADLPWVDGVLYLGALPDAPDVLVPVHRRPAVAGELVRAAVRAVCGRPARAAVIPGDGGVTVLPLDGR